MLKRMIFFVSLPKPKQTNMKQFAFPLSVKCANEQESDQCEELLKSLGYKDYALRGTREIMVTNYMKNCYKYASVSLMNIYNNDRYHIDHFNPELIRDIAAACTNDTWQDDELSVCRDGEIRITHTANVGLSVKELRRPTLSEICAHHGYEIKGRDIVKKIETVSNCDKSYCETARQLDEAKSEIKRLKSENAELREKLEALTDVGNQKLARLQRRVDEMTNKLQHNDKQYEGDKFHYSPLSMEKTELKQFIDFLQARYDELPDEEIIPEL